VERSLYFAFVVVVAVVVSLLLLLPSSSLSSYLSSVGFVVVFAVSVHNPKKANVISTEGGALAAAVERSLYLYLLVRGRKTAVKPRITESPRQSREIHLSHQLPPISYA
jgi:hypothetical protein